MEHFRIDARRLAGVLDMFPKSLRRHIGAREELKATGPPAAGAAFQNGESTISMLREQGGSALRGVLALCRGVIDQDDPRIASGQQLRRLELELGQRNIAGNQQM